MKRFNIIIVLFLVVSVSCAQKKSPRKEAKGSINKATVTIDYSAPSVKGRTVWGGLEKYGKVWRAGADENTTVTFNKTVKINDKSIKAGTYGFFIIPNENGNWVVIFNAKNDGWGAYSYNENEDVVRIEVAPTFVKTNQEQLNYSIGKGTIDFAWEKARLSIPISTK